MRRPHGHDDDGDAAPSDQDFDEHAAASDHGSNDARIPLPIPQVLISTTVPSLRCVVSTAVRIHFIDLGNCANSGTVCSTDVAAHAVNMLIDMLQQRFSCSSASDRFRPLQGDNPLWSRFGS
jgi:hypothetical protein